MILQFLIIDFILADAKIIRKINQSKKKKTEINTKYTQINNNSRVKCVQVAAKGCLESVWNFLPNVRRAVERKFIVRFFCLSENSEMSEKSGLGGQVVC